MNNTENPSQIEQENLRQLEEKNQQMIDAGNQWQAQLTPFSTVTPEQCETRIAYYLNSLEVFRGYVPTAKKLLDLGFPRMSVRLFEIHKDITGVIQTYLEIYQSALQHRAAIARIWHYTTQDILGIMQNVIAARNKTFDDALNSWHILFTTGVATYRACPFCFTEVQHSSMGSFCRNGHRLP
jgi:hypothetical protein